MRRYTSGSELTRWASCIAALLVFSFRSPVPTRADCGQPPPTNINYSSKFYKAEAYFFQNYFHHSADGNFSLGIPDVISIGVGGSTDSSDEQTGYQSLTQAEAYSYIQQEYANHGAQIVAECGYRMCILLDQNVSDAIRIAALGFQETICLGWTTPDGSGGSGALTGAKLLTASPNVVAVEFPPSSTAVVRTIQVQNHSADLATIVAQVGVDYGSNASADGSVTLLKSNGRPLSAGQPLKVKIKPGQSSPVSFMVSPPPSGQEFFPNLLIQQVNNAATTIPVQLSMTSTVASQLPSGGLTVTGQTIAYGPFDDGQLEAGSPFDFVDNGDGTITDQRTGLTWEKKSMDGTLHDARNTYTAQTGSGSIFEWIQQVNAENGGTGFAGHKDWRIANIREVISIKDYGKNYPTVPLLHDEFNANCAGGCTVQSCSCPSAFPTPSWTSTSDPGDPTHNAFATNEWGAGVNNLPRSNHYHVRAVRGGVLNSN